MTLSTKDAASVLTLVAVVVVGMFAYDWVKKLNFFSKGASA